MIGLLGCWAAGLLGCWAAGLLEPMITSTNRLLKIDRRGGDGVINQRQVLIC